MQPPPSVTAAAGSADDDDDDDDERDDNDDDVYDIDNDDVVDEDNVFVDDDVYNSDDNDSDNDDVDVDDEGRCRLSSILSVSDSDNSEVTSPNHVTHRSSFTHYSAPITPSPPLPTMNKSQHSCSFMVSLNSMPFL